MGPSIIGIVLNWFFYGILVMQYFIYLNHSKQDQKWLKAVVHFMFLLDTVQSVLVMDDLFYWFVYHFNDYSSFGHFNYALINGPFLDAIIMFTVQVVYCWRVWRLGGWRVIPAVAVFLAFVACVSGVFVGIYSVVVDPATARRDKPVEELWLFASAVTDIMIACSMGYLLTGLRKEKTSHSAMVLLKRILLLTLETNAITAIMAIALVLTFYIAPVSEPKTNVNVTLGYIIGKLYSNCFMVLLNQQTYYEPSKTLDTGNVNDCQNSVQLSTIRFNDSRTLMEARPNGTPQIENKEDSHSMETNDAPHNVV
ncbi:hypothetical protein Ac2012v2_007976 [Leucoagaricus gongylophorus]